MELLWYTVFRKKTNLFVFPYLCSDVIMTLLQRIHFLKKISRQRIYKAWDKTDELVTDSAINHHHHTTTVL